MKARIATTLTGVILFAAGIAGAQILPAPQAQVLLPGTTIPKFVSQLPVGVPDGSPGGITVVDATSGGTSSYDIHIREFQAQILPAGFAGPTRVWGYLTDADVAAGGVRESYLGPVVVAERGVPAHPTYTNELNNLTSQVQPLLATDMTLDWANPLNIDCQPNPVTGDYENPLCGILPSYTGPWPTAVHIHGGEVAPAFDGGPDAWWTPGEAIMGDGYAGNTFTYPNGQQEATIWFHPHEFGVTRLGVYAGLAGVYPILDPDNPPLADMPHFPEYDIPLIIQDRSFDTNFQLFYNLASNPQPNPTVHPFWTPEFIGDAILVNGKTWPNLNVEPRQYRFRLLNGSNARFYDLTLNMVKPNKNQPDKTSNEQLPFIAIATDGGYLPNAVSTPNVIIGPGERYEVVVNFAGLPVGTQIIVKNAARTPFPGGAKPTTNGTDTVMRFSVVPLIRDIEDPPIIANGTPVRPTPLEPIINGFTPPALPPNPPAGNIVRQLTLNEVIGAGGPLELVINNSKYNLLNTPSILPGTPTLLNRETEIPQVGDTEIWEVINITADAHPMHTHLVTFQLLDRTPFQASKWINQYDATLLANNVFPGGGPPNQYNVRNADGAIGGNPAIGHFLQLNKRTLPLPYEMGWKDTVIMYPGEVTRIVIRWAPQDVAVGDETPGVNQYPFDPTELINGVGYVWHCHILDHEDNEMMRNYVVGTERQGIM